MRTKQEEVDANYDAFVAIYPTIPVEHHGKFALMKDEKIIGFYSTAEDARTSAENFIKDGLYSIQQVSDVAIDLGYFTYAVPVF